MFIFSNKCFYYSTLLLLFCQYALVYHRYYAGFNQTLSLPGFGAFVFIMVNSVGIIMEWHRKRKRNFKIKSIHIIKMEIKQKSRKRTPQKSPFSKSPQIIRFYFSQCFFLPRTTAIPTIPTQDTRRSEPQRYGIPLSPVCGFSVSSGF